MSTDGGTRTTYERASKNLLRLLVNQTWAGEPGLAGGLSTLLGSNSISYALPRRLELRRKNYPAVGLLVDDDRRLWMTAEEHHREAVPYGSGYGVDNLLAQERLKNAAIVGLDHAMLALAELHLTTELRDVFAEHVRDNASREYLLRCAAADSEQEFAVGNLPEIYAQRYQTYDFLKNWIVTLTVVGWKLAQEQPQMLSNMAEELALHMIINDAIADLDMVDADDATKKAASEALRDLYEDAFEDNDFLELYDLEDSDEIVDLDPQGMMGMGDLRFKSWFRPFGSGVDRGVPHPFVLDTEN